MFEQSRCFSRFASVQKSLDPQAQAMVVAVQDALLYEYIAYSSPLVARALEANVMELEANLRQFVLPGTPMRIKHDLAGREDAWDDVSYRRLIRMFQEALPEHKWDTNPTSVLLARKTSLAPPRAESRKVVKTSPSPSSSRLTRVCVCVSWVSNLCVIAGLLGLVWFIAVDERGRDVKFWTELFNPPQCPAEERLKVMYRENLIEARETLERANDEAWTTLARANDEKMAEMLEVVTNATQSVKPEVQSLQNTLEEMKPAVQSLQNSLEKTENRLNTLSEEASVMQSAINRQAKDVNERQAAIDDLMSSIDGTKAKFAAYLAHSETLETNASRRLNEVKAFVEERTNATMENVSRILQDFGENVTEQLRVVNDTVARLNASTTLTMEMIKHRLGNLTRMASEILAKTNDVLYLAGAGPWLNGYVHMTFQSVGFALLLCFVYGILYFCTAWVGKKSTVYKRLSFWKYVLKSLAEVFVWNIGACTCIVLVHKVWSVYAAIRDDPVVQAASYCWGGIVAGYKFVFQNGQL